MVKATDSLANAKGPRLGSMLKPLARAGEANPALARTRPQPSWMISTSRRLTRAPPAVFGHGKNRKRWWIYGALVKAKEDKLGGEEVQGGPKPPPGAPPSTPRGRYSYRRGQPEQAVGRTQVLPCHAEDSRGRHFGNRKKAILDLHVRINAASPPDVRLRNFSDRGTAA